MVMKWKWLVAAATEYPNPEIGERKWRELKIFLLTIFLGDTPQAMAS